MLVLRRQPGESFRIGDNVEIRVLSISRGCVKIGVVAPREVSIYRTELGELNRSALVSNWSDERNQASLRALAGMLRPRATAPKED